MDKVPRTNKPEIGQGLSVGNATGENRDVTQVLKTCMQVASYRLSKVYYIYKYMCVSICIASINGKRSHEFKREQEEVYRRA